MASDGIKILVRIFHSREKIQTTPFRTGFSRNDSSGWKFSVFGLSDVSFVVVFFFYFFYDFLQYVIKKIHLFVCELFLLLYFSVLVLLTFVWLQLPEPINHDQSFFATGQRNLRANGRVFLPILQQGVQNRCLFVCSVRKKAALIIMLDCCSMPPYQIFFWKF